MLARVHYRTLQMWRQLIGRIPCEDQALVESVLSPQLLALFERQRPGDRAHAVRVCRALLAQGYSERPLLQAALLHDAGKVLGLPLPYRAAAVVLRRLAPGWLARLAAAGERRRWLRPFAVSLSHPALGARLAAEAGAEPATVTLIAYHQEAVAPDEALAPLLRALQAVDDRN